MKKCLRNLILILGIMFACMLLSTSKVRAEGTREIYDYAKGGSRINFNNIQKMSHGVRRITVVNTYAKAGETVKFAVAGQYVDITYPDGTVQNYTVGQYRGAAGYIYNSTEEQAKSYTPLEFTATQTGVYSIRFRPSVLQQHDEGNSDIDIIEITDTKAFAANDFLIEAWDVSVYNEQGNEVPGRSWLDFWSGYVGWNGGNTGVFAQTNVNFYCYMLTPDGYTYKMNFDKVDPMGFVVYGSTRGFINTEDNTVLYHSYRESSGDSNSDDGNTYYDLNTNRINPNISIPSPGYGESKFDKYCKIFVSKPAEDLPKTVKVDPVSIEITNDLKYIGTGENEGLTKSAGIFSFGVSDICNYTIEIKNVATGEIVRKISNTALAGMNSVYWDGKDESGNYVPAGNFEGTLKVRNGEYHFILFDFEYIRDGVSIESEESGKVALYYDDTGIGGDNHSESEVEKYPSNPESFDGNERAVNLWTYTNIVESVNFFLLDENPNEDFILSGLVFEDKDKSATYNMYIDSLLSDVRLTITNTETGDVYHVITATNGMYYANVPAGTYRIEVDSDNPNIDYYICTTNNTTQQVTVTQNTRADDIGYHVEYRDVRVKKIWNDTNDANNLRPQSLHIKLYSNSTLLYEYDLTDADNWEHKFDKLPCYDTNGDEITYTVQEDAVADYNLVRNESTKKLYENLIELENSTEKKAIRVIKKWDDYDNKDQTRPEKVYVQAMVGNLVVKQIELSALTNWKGTITNLERFDSNGNIINYTVREVAVDYYNNPQIVTLSETDSEKVVEITNTLRDDIVNIHVKKNWDDLNNKDGLRPESITVKIKNGNQVVREQEITAADNWTGIVKGLPKYNLLNEEINYTVEEADVQYYNMTDSNIEVRADKKVDIGLSSTSTDPWTQNADGVWQSSIEAGTSVLQTDEINTPVPTTISFDMSVSCYHSNAVAYASYKITNLDTNEVIVGNGSSTQIYGISRGIAYDLMTYDKISEEVPAGRYRVEFTFYRYGTGYSEGLNTAFVKNVKYTVPANAYNASITNTERDDLVNIKIKKNWDDYNNKDGIRPGSITVNVKNGNQIVKSVEIKAGKDWQGIANGLDRYDAFGHEINYTIDEEDVEGYRFKNQSEYTWVKDIKMYPTLVPENANLWTHNSDGSWQSKNTGGTAIITSEPFTLAQASSINFTWAVGGTSSSYGQYTITNTANNQVVAGTGSSTKRYGGSSSAVKVEKELEAGTYTISFSYYRSGSTSGTNAITINNLMYEDVSNTKSVSITNEQNTVSLKVNKIWNDFDNKDGVRPSSITVNVKNGNEVVRTAVIKADENWTKTIVGLPKTDNNGRTINYTVAEDDVESYTLENTSAKYGVADTPADLNLTSSTGSYIWQQNTDGTWQSKNSGSTASLTSDTFTTAVPTVLSFDWSVSCANNSSIYAYYEIRNTATNQVVEGTGTSTKINGTSRGTTYANLTFDHVEKELAPGTYKITFYYYKGASNYGGVDAAFVKNVKYNAVTNTEAIDLTNKINSINIKVKKDWEDYNNKDGIRPSSITVNAKNGDVVAKSTVIKEEDGWEGIITGLPKYDNNGHEITYTISENPIEGYAVKSVSNFTDYADTEIDLGMSSNISGWAQNTDGTWKSTNPSATGSVTTENFTVTTPTTLSFDWSVSCYSNTNYAYAYYTITNVDTNQAIDNTGTAATTRINGTSRGTTYASLAFDHVEKELQPGTYKITFYFYRNSSYSGGLNAAFVKNIKYIGTTNTKYVEIVNAENSNNLIIDKKWDDGNDKDGLRPESVTIQIKNENEVLKEAEIKAEDNWHAVVNGVPKYDSNNNEINYTIAERNVEHYSLVDVQDKGLIKDYTQTLTPSEISSWQQRSDGTWETTNTASNSTATMKMAPFKTNIATTLSFDMSVSCYNSSSYGVYYILKDTTTNTTIADTSSSKIYGTSRGTVYNSLTYEHVNIPIDNPGTYEITFYFYRYGTTSGTSNGLTVGLNQGFVKNIKFDDATNTKQYEIKNQILNDYTNVKIQKDWIDYNNKDGLRPESITVDVKNGNEVVRTVQVTAADGWKKLVAGLPIKDGNNNDINYTISERSINNYNLVGNESIGLVLDTPNSLGSSSADQWTRNADGVWESTNSADGSVASLTMNPFTSEGATKIGFDYSVSCYDSNNYGTYYTVKNTVTNEVVADSTNNKIYGTSRGNSYQNLTYDHEEVEIDTPGTYQITFYFRRFTTSSGNILGLNKGFVKNVAYYTPSNTNGYKLTNEENAINFKLQKSWTDYDDKDGLRPESVNVKVKRGNEVVREVEIKEEDNWETTVVGLPKFDENNNEIVYTFVEDNIENYKYIGAEKVSSIENTDVIRIKNEINSINIKIDKKWEDYNNLDGVRPEKITVEVKNGDNVVREVDVKAENDWSATVVGLPKYDNNGNEINYTINEKRVEGYSLTKNEGIGYVMDYIQNVESQTANTWQLNSDNVWETTTENYKTGTLTMAPFTTDDEAVLSFDLSVSSYNSSPFGLYYKVVNTVTGDTVVDTTNNKLYGTTRGTTYASLTYDHVDIELDDPGTYQAIFYFYRYDGSNSSYGLGQAFVKNITYKTYGNTKTFELENTERDDIVNIKLDKKWDDYDNKDLTRPESILVDVKKGNEIVRTVEVTAANNWQTTVGGLARLDENDNEITYTFSERSIENYELVGNQDLGYIADFALPMESQTATSWNQKDDGTWQSTNGTNSTATLTMEEFTTDIPTEISFDMSVSCYNTSSYGVYYIVKNTQTNETVVDTSSNRIYGTARGTAYDSLQFDHVDIPIENAGTYQITFYFQRAGSSSGLNQGFIKNVTYKKARNTKQQILSNKLNDIINVRVKKNWNDYDNKDLTRPENITVYVKNGNEVIRTVPLSEADDWSTIINGLPRVDGNNNEITYTFEEANVEGYALTNTLEYDVKDLTQNVDMIPSTTWTQNSDGTWKSTNTNNTGSITTENFTFTEPTTISFDWSVSCNANTSYAYANYTITNVDTNQSIDNTGTIATTRINGTSRGTVYDSLTYDHIEKELQPGTYKITFNFYRNSSYSGGLNAAFVKNVSYKVASNTKAVELTNTIDSSTLVIEKKWNDYGNKNGGRPSSINVDVKNGDTVVRTTQITAQDNWKKKVIGLPRLDNLGNPINYTVSENEVTGYNLTGVNYRDVADYPTAMTNSSASSFSQKADGTWESTNGASSRATLTMAPFTTTVPTKISFDMSVSCYNSSNYGMYYIVKETSTNKTIYDTTSQKIYGTTRGTVYEDLQYDHVDLDIENPGTYQIIFYFYRYSSSTGGLNKGFVKNITYDTISNSRLVTLTNEDKTLSVRIKKIWDDSDNSENTRPESVTVELKNGSSTVREVQLTAQDNWETIITGLDKFDSNNELITYTATESSVENYILMSNENTGIAKDWEKNIEVSTNTSWQKKDDGTWESTNGSSSTATLTMAPFTTTTPGKISFDMSVSCYNSTSYGMYYVVKNTSTNQTVYDTTSQKIYGTTRGTSYDSLQYDHVDLDIENPGTYQIVFYFNRNSSSTGGLNKGFVKNIKLFEEGSTEVIELTNKLNLKSIKISKEWKDNNDAAGERPQSINVKLMNGNSVAAEHAITAENNWEYTFSVPVYNSNGEEIEYTISEDEVEKYTLEGIDSGVSAEFSSEGQYPWTKNADDVWVSGNYNVNSTDSTLMSTQFTTTNSINVGFDWAVSSENGCDFLYYIVKDANNSTVLGGNSGNTRISGTANGTAYESLTFNPVSFELQPGTYTLSFVYHKDSSQNGGLDRGYVKNISIGNNSSNGYTITNRYVPDAVDITVEKVWSDNSNQAGKRPEAVTINVKNGNTVADTYSLTANDKKVVGTVEDANTWVHVFSLPVVDDLGNEITYTVEEECDSIFYSSEVGSIDANTNTATITNTFSVPDDKINLTVVKAWNDNNNAAGKRPESIQVQLYADNVAQGEAVTITNSNWSTVFNNLPVYKENGDVIAYTVREVNSNNIYYSEKSNVLNTETNTVTITNEFSVPDDKINLTVVKAWDDNNNAAGKRPTSIKVQLYANSVAQGNQVTITNSNWSTVFNNLAKYDENGDEISYTVSEVNSNSIFYSEKSNVLNTETNTVTITNEFAVPNDTINVTVRKVWDDNNDAASKRPQSLNVELSNGDDYDLSDDNEWLHTFTGLPKYDANGNVIAYTASENMTNADQRNYQLADSVTSNDANGNITVELTNRFIPSQEKVQITVEKVWDDNSNSASKRPESLDISILNGNNIEDTYSYTSEDKLDTDSNTWSHTFELPKYDRYNDPITYVAEEDFESIFYTAEVGAIDANNKITITNTFSVPDDKINLTVVKAWDDNNNAAGKRPESIDVQLYANRTAVGNSITITNENWSTVFNNLPVYDENGNKFSYSVREVNSDSIYYSEKSNVLNAQTNTITITNEFAIPADTVSVKVVKVWDDNSNEAEKRPESLEVELSNGNKYTLTDSDKTSDNVWEHTFTGLRKYNSTTGDEIVYTAVENFSDVNYAQESETNVVSGIKTITFTNTFTPLTEKVNVTVTKVWDDNDNEAGKRPTSVSVELKNGSAVVGQATLNASNGWSHEFENLPKYNSRNDEINYTAVENCDSIFYEESGNSKSNNVITITNEFVVPDDTVNVEVVKVWDDTNNRDNVRPSSIVLVLSDETGAEVDTHEVSGNTTSNEGWAYTFTGLAKYDRLGNEKSYTVDEQVVDNNYIKSINGRIITNTYKLNNPIVEDDEIKKTGPETITKSKELLNYKLEYKATVKDFVGKATVTIVDTLPYEINVQTSNLDGGVYDSDAKTITWVEEVENIDTYANGSKAISIVKNIAVEYVDLDVNESELRNVATANIKLDRTSVEESVEDDHTSSVGIYGKVIVHYIDVDTEESIADDTVLTGKPGQKYETTAKDIKFYVLDSSEGEIKGEFAEEVKHVYYKYRKLKFNLAIEEKITAIKVDDEFIDVGDGKFEKFTLKNKASNVRVFYAVTVKNTGDIPGSATVRASIPTEMKFASASEGWVERDGTLLVDVEELDVGDSVVYQIALDWVAEEKSFEAITDIAQIIEARNEAGFEDEDDTDNESSAAHQIVYEEEEKTIAQTVGNIVRSIKTGDNVLVYVSLVILSTIGIAICVARRRK